MASNSQVVYGPSTPQPPTPRVIIHGPHDRPIDPPGGTIYRDPISGRDEQWNGEDWVRLPVKNK